MFIPTAYAETVHATAASGGLGALGLNLNALLFQILNFGILLALLKAFAYKPILKIIEERRQHIAEGLATADLAREQQIKWAKEVQELRRRSQEEAAHLLQQSKAAATAVIAKAEAAAQAQQQTLLAQAQAQIDQNVASARRQLQQEIVSLTYQATEHIIGQKLDDAGDRELVAARVKKLMR